MKYLNSKNQGQIFILIGPKGAGKTYLGTRMEAELGLPFLRVEDIWLKLMHENRFHGQDFDEEGQRRVLYEITKQITLNGQIVFESTGVAPWFLKFVEELKIIANVHLIKVHTPIDLCFDRVQQRNQEIHIPVSKERLNEINLIAEKVEFPWTLIIENSSETEADQFLLKFKAEFLDSAV